MIKVLFVCRANICRSPTAEAVFSTLVDASGLRETIQTDSAGTNAPWPDRVPDLRAQKAANARGYDLSIMRARQLTLQLARDNDYLVVMDDRNYQDAMSIIDPEDEQKLSLLLSWTSHEDKQLYDPFFSGSDGFGFIPNPVDSGESAFISALDKIEEACEALLKHICAADLNSAR